jgi:hypothetical protein
VVIVYLGRGCKSNRKGKIADANSNLENSKCKAIRFAKAYSAGHQDFMDDKPG